MINFGIAIRTTGTTLATIVIVNGALARNEAAVWSYESKRKPTALHSHVQSQPSETGTPVSLFGCYKSEADSNHVEASIQAVRQSVNKVLGYFSLLNFMHNQPAQAGGSEAIFVAQQMAPYFSASDLDKLQRVCELNGGKAHFRIENMYFYLPRQASPNEAQLVPLRLLSGLEPTQAKPKNKIKKY